MKKVLVILAVLLFSFGIYYLITATKDYNAVLAKVNEVNEPNLAPVIYGKCPVHGDLSQWDIMRFSFKVGNVQATSERFCAHCVYQYIVKTLRQNIPAIEVNGVSNER